MWRAYRENFDVVLPVAVELQRELNGKSVITSDHGNEFGTRAYPVFTRIYGHPRGLRTEGLIKVPWVVYESEVRRDVRPGDIQTSDTPASTIVAERLFDLGYK